MIEAQQKTGRHFDQYIAEEKADRDMGYSTRDVIRERLVGIGNSTHFKLGRLALPIPETMRRRRRGELYDEADFAARVWVASEALRWAANPENIKRAFLERYIPGEETNSEVVDYVDEGEIFLGYFTREAPAEEVFEKIMRRAVRKGAIKLGPVGSSEATDQKAILESFILTGKDHIQANQSLGKVPALMMRINKHLDLKIKCHRGGSSEFFAVPKETDELNELKREKEKAEVAKLIEENVPNAQNAHVMALLELGYNYQVRQIKSLLTTTKLNPLSLLTPREIIDLALSRGDYRKRPHVFIPKGIDTIGQFIFTPKERHLEGEFRYSLQIRKGEIYYEVVITEEQRKRARRKFISVEKNIVGELFGETKNQATLNPGKQVDISPRTLLLGDLEKQYGHQPQDWRDRAFNDCFAKTRKEIERKLPKAVRIEIENAREKSKDGKPNRLSHQIIFDHQKGEVYELVPFTPADGSNPEYQILYSRTKPY